MAGGPQHVHMTSLVIGLAWLVLGGLATVVMVAIGRAGHWEDVQRGCERSAGAPTGTGQGVIRPRPLLPGEALS